MHGVQNIKQVKSVVWEVIEVDCNNHMERANTPQRKSKFLGVTANAAGSG
jgi:hypothetical protein